MIQVPPCVSQDPLLSTLLDQLNIIEQALFVRSKELGEKNTDVIKLQAQKSTLEGKVDESVKGILVALDAKVASLKESLDSLGTEVRKATDNDIEKAKQSRPYYDKKRELDEQIRFRQVLTMKVASEQIDQNLPKTMMVEIMDQAK